MTTFVIGYQEILFRGAWPDPRLLAAAAAFAAGSLLLGFRLFDRFKPRFAEIA